MSAVAVVHSLPAEIIAVDPVAMERASALVAKAKACIITDAESHQDASATYKGIVSLAKAIADSRLDITRPINDLIEKIMDAERQATVPLMETKKTMETVIGAYEAQERQKRAEAARKAQEEAERVAAIERKRLKDEQDARIAAAKLEREKAEAKAAEEAALFGSDAAPVEIPEIPEEREIVVVPTVNATLLMPEPAKSVIQKTVTKKLVIDDEKLIPLDIQGVRLWLVDEKAVEKLMRAGIPIPGCRLQDVERLGAAGR